MSNNLIKAITTDGSIRAYAVDGTKTVSTAQKLHNMYPTASAALGRTMMAAQMMGAMLKDNSSISIIINGGGPMGNICAVTDKSGNVKGYVHNPYLDVPIKSNGKLDVSFGVGTDGTITVIKDMGLKEPYVGKTPIITGEIAEDITNYFVQSEQTPTVCALGVLVETDASVRAAGGYIIQLMPNASNDAADKIENNIKILKPVSTLIDEGLSPEDIIRKALDGFDVQILEEREVAFVCDCSRERTKSALLSLGKKELSDMLESPEKTELVCSFCSKKYEFGKEELKKLIDSLDTENR